MFTLFYLSNITGCDYHVTETYDPDVAEIKETAQAQFWAHIMTFTQTSC